MASSGVISARSLLSLTLWGRKGGVLQILWGLDCHHTWSERRDAQLHTVWTSPSLIQRLQLILPAVHRECKGVLHHWVKYDFWLPPSNTIPTFRVYEGSLRLVTSATAVCRRTILLEPTYIVEVVDGWTVGLIGGIPVNTGASGFNWMLEGLVTFDAVPPPLHGRVLSWSTGVRLLFC